MRSNKCIFPGAPVTHCHRHLVGQVCANWHVLVVRLSLPGLLLLCHLVNPWTLPGRRQAKDSPSCPLRPQVLGTSTLRQFLVIPVPLVAALQMGRQWWNALDLFIRYISTIRGGTKPHASKSFHFFPCLALFKVCVLPCVIDSGCLRSLCFCFVFKFLRYFFGQ